MFYFRLHNKISVKYNIKNVLVLIDTFMNKTGGIAALKITTALLWLIIKPIYTITK